VAGPKLERRDDAASRNVAGNRLALEAEARKLAEVQRALRDRRPHEALRLLNEQDRAFPSGALGEERAAARVFALCEAGEDAQARALAAQFLLAHPSSPFAERVQATCSR
jgi:hypothetical protein